MAAEVGGTAFAIDVSDEAAIVAMVEAVRVGPGPIDVFVSNAGFVTSGGVEDTNERIQKMMDARHGPHLRRSGRAAIDDRPR
ncbi:MAG: SDR family oxidoreductase [Acidimicrobiales bacterium]